MSKRKRSKFEESDQEEMEGDNFEKDAAAGEKEREKYICHAYALQRASLWNITAQCGKLDSCLELEPQDADYYLPVLCDNVEAAILARFPLSKYWKLCLLNNKYLELHKNGELFKLRKIQGISEFCVFMRAGEEKDWLAFDREFKSCKRLPEIPSDDFCFITADRETLCAGTHLIVSGRETFGDAIWRYELGTNEWSKGPSMIDPRCMFASVTCGDFAFVAGGIRMGTRQVLNSAEKYDSETRSWEPLPRMKEGRKACSGVYMDKKFYVFGGQKENGDALTCGEVFDELKNTWVGIPGMLNGLPGTSSGSPQRLVSVVNNELYLIETFTNCLMVYMKESNSWKDLGLVPVKTGEKLGWGVAFRSLGDELLLMGGSSNANSGSGMIIYTCRPNPHAGEVHWKLVDAHKRTSNFIWNCCVMEA